VARLQNGDLNVDAYMGWDVDTRSKRQTSDQELDGKGEEGIAFGDPNCRTHLESPKRQ
jgi:hypothetical protein